MGYSADKSPLIGHLAGPIRRLKPLGAQRQEKCGPNHLTREGLHATTPRHTLAALIAAHPDRTLAELKDALATPARVPTVWGAVRALGLTVKHNGPPVRTRSA